MANLLRRGDGRTGRTRQPDAAIIYVDVPSWARDAAVYGGFRDQSSHFLTESERGLGVR